MNSRFYTMGLALLLVVMVIPGIGLGADPGPAATRWPVRPLADVARHLAPDLDRAALALEDLDRKEQGLPYRFALTQEVSLSPETAGTWETLPSGRNLWRLRITSRDVLSVNLGFTRFWLPPDARLLVYPSSDEGPVQIYDESDNAGHEQLWTPVLLTDEVVVELEVDPALRWQVELELTSIGRGYRFFGEDFTEKSGTCNIDVVCPEGDPWRDEIDAIGVYSMGGGTLCTGFMTNNTAQDGKPYFMTAYHCDVREFRAPSVVVYWNFQSPTCGQQGGGSLAQNQTGSILRAEYQITDVTLLELDDLPDPAFNVKYAGWNRGGTVARSAVCIHHPSTDEKSISFENNPLSVTTYQENSSPGDGTHLRVGDWDAGTTERGSSGAPLFDQDHYVIGQLHGGGAACGNNLPDWYGWFHVSWEGGGSSANRLSDWLDPLGTGALTVEVLDPFSASFEVAPAAGFISSGVQGGPFDPVEMVYTLTNTGDEVAQFTTTVSAPWLIVTPDSGSVPVGGTAQVTVGLAASAVDLEVGEHQSNLQITNTGIGTGTTIRPVTLTVDPYIGSFEVTPADGFVSSGIFGGPFEPLEMVYTLTHVGNEEAQFTATVPASWLTVSPGSGTIPVGGSVDVTVGLGSSAVNLSVGRHQSGLEITNNGLGTGTTVRAVTVTVMSNVPHITGVVPNPFGGPAHSTTEIRFTLAGAATVRARIHDIRGARVKDLGSMVGEAEKENHFTWDGTGQDGARQASGVYVFIMEALGREEKINIMLVH